MKYDLTHVDPHRRPEVMKRIKAVERFNLNPGRSTAEAEAKAIGLVPSAFYTLVRAWNAYHDPTKLPGTRRRPRGSAISDTVRNLVRETNREMPHAIVEDVLKAVRKRAVLLNIELPHDNTVRGEVRRARQGQLPALPEGVTHVLDHCSLNVPVETGEYEPMRGILTALFSVRHSKIVGAELGTQIFKEEDAAVAMAFALAAGSVRPGDKVLIDRPASQGWDRLVEALEGEGLTIVGERFDARKARSDTGELRKRGNGRTLLAACGRYIAGYEVKVGVYCGPAKLKRGAQPMTLAAAKELVISRILAPTAVDEDALAAVLDRLSRSS